MKKSIFRLLLLATSILFLGCSAPVQSKTISKEKIETLREALIAASERSNPVTIEAAYDEALNIVQALKPQETEYDKNMNLKFQYADKWFVLEDDEAGKESSFILYGKTKVVLFVPETKKK